MGLAHADVQPFHIWWAVYHLHFTLTFTYDI